MKNEIFYTNPNLSIVLPGPCQAKCDFCFWYQKPTDKDWLRKLEYILDTLPSCFEQISITGGEPTLSQYLVPTLDLIKARRKRYPKVVMTTNGIKLGDFLDPVYKTVDHVNISRHHWKQEENEKVFKTKNIPTDKDLMEYAEALLNKLTFNCVIKTMSTKGMYKFLRYASGLGVSNVCFRQEHGSLDPVTVEKHLLKKYKKTGEGGCPVCRGSYFDVPLKTGTMNVGIKYSVLEPKDVIDGIYELVFHSDGKLTADWEANVEIDLVKE